MNFLSNRIVALLLWTLPALLFVIAAALLMAGLEQRQVAESGEPVMAEIIEIVTQQRSEISRGHLHLQYVPPGGIEPVVREVEMPMTFLKDLEVRPDVREVEIRVIGDRGQVVLAEHQRGQWILTLSFAGMALMGALGLAWMVGAWNRFLARHGDPAHAPEAA